MSAERTLSIIKPDAVAAGHAGEILSMIEKAGFRTEKRTGIVLVVGQANAAEGTVRKRFATDIERNCIHGSDAPETAATELAFFFSGAELV